VWSQRARERIASEVERVSHWKVQLVSYDEVPTLEQATYFVDPPYVDKGRYYRCNHVDHAAIGAWAKTLPGQAIVCEQQGADWLPFQPLASIKSTKGRSEEVVYLQRQLAGGHINITALGERS
jgi:16S rRNA G966 N2-methylase RsmD